MQGILHCYFNLFLILISLFYSSLFCHNTISYSLFMNNFILKSLLVGNLVFFFQIPYQRNVETSVTMMLIENKWILTILWYYKIIFTKIECQRYLLKHILIVVFQVLTPRSLVRKYRWLRDIYTASIFRVYEMVDIPRKRNAYHMKRTDMAETGFLARNDKCNEDSGKK